MAVADSHRPQAKARLASSRRARGQRAGESLLVSIAIGRDAGEWAVAWRGVAQHGRRATMAATDNRLKGPPGSRAAGSGGPHCPCPSDEVPQRGNGPAGLPKIAPSPSSRRQGVSSSLVALVPVRAGWAWPRPCIALLFVSRGRGRGVWSGRRRPAWAERHGALRRGARTRGGRAVSRLDQSFVQCVLRCVAHAGCRIVVVEFELQPLLPCQRLPTCSCRSTRAAGSRRFQGQRGPCEDTQ